MATTTSRRPGRRRPAATTTVAPTRAEPPSWPRDAAVLAFGAVAAAGVAFIAERLVLAGVVLVGGMGLSIFCGVLGRRTEKRAELARRLAEAIAPLLGMKHADLRSVRVSRWRGEGRGHPTRVVLHYAPAVDDTDPEWLLEVKEVVDRRLLTTYRVARHDRGGCRIFLEWKPANQEEAPTSPTQARAERTVTELLGPTARVATTEFESDDGELSAFVVHHQTGTKLAAQGYRTRIERVMSTMLPGRWRAQWDLVGDSVRFEERPTMPRTVPHPPPAIDADSQYRLPVAVGEDGETISWHLRGGAPHAIVVGKTGQGKTVVINGLVMEACYRGWRVWICDPKRIEFMGLRSWPNIQIVATTVEDQVAVIFHAWEEMEERYSLIESGQADEDDFEPLILVLDEYRDFVGSATAWYSEIKVRGMPAKNPVFEKVSSLARKGRSARVHVILGTQRPDAEFLGGEMRDNFATRISLGRLSPQGALMMWEAAYIGVAVPRSIPGRGTGEDEDGRPTEVQAYWTPDPRRLTANATADREILESLIPAEITHPALQVVMSEELLHPEDDDPRIWEAVRSATLEPCLEPRRSPLEQIRNPADRGSSPAELLASPTPLTADPAGRAPAPVPVEEDIEPAWDEDYGPATEIAASGLSAGDLILVDEATDQWAVVETDVEEDIDDPDLVCIDWRTDDDDAGSLAVPQDSTVSARRPTYLDNDLEEES